MGAYKEGKNWKVQVYYKAWQGNRKRKQKRGFRTKGEAKEWERDFLQQQSQGVDTAVRAMVDSNLQRPNILSSEKAFAYRMKMEAMNHQGTSSGISAKDIGKNANDSARQVYRYIRLTYLMNDLLNAVELMLDAICSTKPYQQINGEAVPTQVVKSRLLKVGYEHIQCVFFSLDRSTSKVKNIRQRMLTVLYNAPATINQFYDAEVRHDMYWGKDIPAG